MARRRFFVPEIRRGFAELTGSDAEHLVRVLRVEPGQQFEISDNRDVYLAEISTARKSVVSFKVVEKMEAKAAIVRVTLLPALFKFDRFEWLIEKATELGVHAIQPFEATRTERGLAQASTKRLARWQKIALEASQQSRRANLPEIRPIVRFAISLDAPANVRLLLDEASGIPPILQCLPAQRKLGEDVGILLGPEGGWTEEERTLAVNKGWQACSLGETILRAETAGIAAAAVVQAAWFGASFEPA
jgi:16S rRNA (uracil1498-N3)-methyltransferase